MPMSPRLQRLTLTGHVALSVGWLGAAGVYLAVAVRALVMQDADFARAAYPILEFIGWFVIVPASLAAFLSGLIQSLGTPWGVFRHYWVIAKLLLTVVGTVVLLLHMPAVGRVVSAAAETSSSIDLGIYPLQLVLHAAAGSALLLVVTTLSIYKPWGKTPWARQARSESSIA